MNKFLVVALMLIPTAAVCAETEPYTYACEILSGLENETHLVRVDSQKNTLQWRGKTYRITVQPECGKFGWHVTGHGTSFDFCTATKGVAGFENQPKSVAEPIREGEEVGCSRFVND